MMLIPTYLQSAKALSCVGKSPLDVAGVANVLISTILRVGGG